MGAAILNLVGIGPLIVNPMSLDVHTHVVMAGPTSTPTISSTRVGVPSKEVTGATPIPYEPLAPYVYKHCGCAIQLQHTASSPDDDNC